MFKNSKSGNIKARTPVATATVNYYRNPLMSPSRLIVRHRSLSETTGQRTSMFDYTRNRLCPLTRQSCQTLYVQMTDNPLHIDTHTDQQSGEQTHSLHAARSGRCWWRHRCTSRLRQRKQRSVEGKAHSTGYQSHPSST